MSEEGTVLRRDGVNLKEAEPLKYVKGQLGYADLQLAKGYEQDMGLHIFSRGWNIYL